MSGYLDKYTPSAPYPRSLLGLFFASVPQTIFLFALIVGINLSEYNEVLQGVSGLVLLVLFVSFVFSTHVAQTLFRDVAKRAGRATEGDSAFRRLASAGVSAAVGVPTFIYGVFVALLNWPVQQSLYIGEPAAFGSLLVGIISLYYAHRTATDVSEQAKSGSDQTAAPSETDQAGDDPVELLKHRYAAGELSEEEFERKLDHLIESTESISSAESSFESELGEALAETE